MDTSIYSKSDKELLEWELSLSTQDLRSASWYHGNLPRNIAELLLEEDGEFLVRDSSTFARSGDYVLSTKHKGAVLHFLIHKEVMQPNTIYEQLGYRFENESFTTVQDLITHYIGNKEVISARSGAVISIPTTRNIPISRKDRIHQLSELMEYADYASIAHEATGRQVLPVEAILIEKSFAPEGLNQVSLNLKPPPDLLEELEHIPDKIRNLEEYKKLVSFQSETVLAPGKSNFELDTFSSILLPMKLDDVTMNPEIIEQINSRIMEVSDRAMAYNITCVDMKILKQEKLQDDGTPEEEEPFLHTDSRITRVCERVLNDSKFRWNQIIERSFTFSHFVIITILGAQSREDMTHKWIGIANELKIGMGNFFSFCNIMRGLTSPKISSMDGPVDWQKLRQNYTNSTFSFETTLRNSHHNLLQGNESYPPNTTIPNLLPVSLIFEGNTDLSPLLNDCSEEEKLKMTVAHLRQFYLFSDNEDSYNKNWERIQNDTNIVPDIVLGDISLTETQLLILWGSEQYNLMPLSERCQHFANLSTI